MGFFDKLKKELQFKKLGKGKSLTSEPPQQRVPPQQSSSSKSPRKPSSSSDAQNAAREAAMARLAGKKPTSTNKSNNNILRRAREELLEEKRRQAEVERQSQINESTKTVNNSKDTPSVCQNNGVYFKCPLTNTRLQRYEIDDHLLEVLAQFIDQHKTSSLNQCYNAPDAEDFMVLLNIVYTINDCNDEKYKTCMATLTTYLNNIISNSDQEKFRKIRKSNKAFQNRIASFNCGSNLLEIIGFRLKELPNNDGNNEEYYVFDINVYNSSSTPNFIDILAQWVYNFSQDPNRVIFELDSNAQLFYKAPGGKSTNSNDLPADFYNISKTELKSMYVNQEKEREFNSVLMSAETRQKMLSLKTKKYKYCMIRIKFPDELILQGTFRTTDTTDKVFTFVKNNIIFEEVIGGIFKLTCGNEHLKDSKEMTLEKFAPSCMFMFRLDSSLVNDLREQSGSLHLVKKELLCNIQQL